MRAGAICVFFSRLEWEGGLWFVWVTGISNRLDSRLEIELAGSCARAWRLIPSFCGAFDSGFVIFAHLSRARGRQRLVWGLRHSLGMMAYKLS